MERRRPRILLPTPTRGGEPVHPGQGDDHQEGKKRKRRPQSIACDNCRAKKVACDGQRPACKLCLRRKIECVYRQDRRVTSETHDALRRQNEALQESLNGHVSLLEQLKNLPEEMAVRLLHDIRACPSSRPFIDAAHGSMHARYRPSDLTTAQSLYTQTDSLFDFELSAQHQFIYPKSTRFDSSQLVAFLNSSALTASDGSSNSLSSRQTSNSPSGLSSQMVQSGGHPRIDPLDMPQVGRLCDERLVKLQIDFWTRVPIPNSMAASAISFYLENDHPIVGVFDADLFLTDLVEKRLRHCSSFLVSALLCFACQAYARNDARSASFVSELFREATTLWHSEKSSTHNHASSPESSPFEPITTLAATLLMSLASHLDGRDASGYEFLCAGRRIATEHGLLDATLEAGGPFERLRRHSQQWITSAAHAAWATYNWISAASFYFHEPPIQYPPMLPVPGSGSGPAGGFFVKHAGHAGTGFHAEKPLQMQMGRTFQTLCRFWEIMQEVIIVYHQKDHRPLRERVPLAFAEARYQKLLAWTNSIDSSMSRREHVPAHVLIFHLIFHCMVIQIFHPFMSENSPFARQKMRSFSSSDSCPAAVITTSLNRLGYLMFQFQRENTPATWSVYINPPLVQLGDAMLNQRFRNAADRRLVFLLCIRAWVHLYKSFSIFWDIVKGFLARALRERLVSSDEARRLLKAVRHHGQYHKVPEQTVSSIIIDFHTAEDNPEMARIKAIAGEFEDLALQEEFTTGSFDVESFDDKV